MFPERGSLIEHNAAVRLAAESGRCLVTRVREEWVKQRGRWRVIWSGGKFCILHLVYPLN
jgi:hypothetical protein